MSSPVFRGEQTMKFPYAPWQVMSPSLNLLHSILVTQKSDFVNAWRFVRAWLHSSSSLRPRRNLTSFSNVCRAALWFLFWASSGFNEVPEVRFLFPFILIGQSTMAFFNRPIMARTQILVHRLGLRTRISALFRRQPTTQAFLGDLVFRPSLQTPAQPRTTFLSQA